MTRCKPHQLVVIIEAPANWTNAVGRFLTTGCLNGTDDFGNICWSYEGSRIFSDDGCWQATGFPDVVLLPIEDPGDDAVDEMVQLLGVPA